VVSRRGGGGGARPKTLLFDGSARRKLRTIADVVGQRYFIKRHDDIISVIGIEGNGKSRSIKRIEKLDTFARILTFQI